MNQDTDIMRYQHFDSEKRTVLQELGKTDQSKKGSVDHKIKAIIDTINNQSEYYTTSSCAGRILCLGRSFPIQKNKVEWLFVTHNITDPQQIAEKYLLTVREKNEKHPDIWFKQEPPILHVCAQTLEAANILLRLAYEAGLKRSGIVSISNVGRIIVGLLTSETIETPLRVNGENLVSDEYLMTLVILGAQKLEHARSKLHIVQKKIEMLNP